MRSTFLSSAEFFQINFSKHCTGLSSKSQTGLIQIRLDILYGPDLGPNCWQKLSEVDSSAIGQKKLKLSLSLLNLLSFIKVCFPPYYLICPNYLNTFNSYHIGPKTEANWFDKPMRCINSHKMANNVNSDQTAPSGAV